jgi:integrase
MVAMLPGTVIGIRDKAMLLVGFAGALRRSEIVALTLGDVAIGEYGLTLTLRRSKTDQAGAGRTVGIPYGRDPATCPVKAMLEYLHVGGMEAGVCACRERCDNATHVGGEAHIQVSGEILPPPAVNKTRPNFPIFRSVDKVGRVSERALSGRDVARAVKRAASAIGLDAAAFAGHSLRAGFATTAAHAGVEEREIMRQTGHRSVAVARRYMRDAGLFRNNAAGMVGL